MKKLYKKMLWKIIGILEYKMDNEENFKKANKIYWKMERLKTIVYNL